MPWQRARMPLRCPDGALDMSMGREPEVDVDTDGALETVDVDMETILKRSKNPYMQAYFEN